MLWFAIAVSPVSHVFFVEGVLLGERTLYLPSVGAVVFFAWLRVYREATLNLGAHYGLTTQIGRKLLEAGNLRGSEGLLRQAWNEAPDVASAPALLGCALLAIGRRGADRTGAQAAAR